MSCRFCDFTVKPQLWANLIFDLLDAIAAELNDFSVILTDEVIVVWAIGVVRIVKLVRAYQSISWTRLLSVNRGNVRYTVAREMELSFLAPSREAGLP